MLRRIKEGLVRFMYGRYGTDRLNMFLMILSLVMLALNLIIRSQIFYILCLLVLVIYTFRSFSKNISKRQAENNKYMKMDNKVKKYIKLQKDKWRDRKTHIYRTCPDCKTVLRLPRKKGRHKCSCPKCHKNLDVTVR